MKSIKQLLGNPPRAPISVAPNDTVIHALRVMADQDIGAVVVMDENKLIGIFSERDYARKVVLKGKDSTDTKVGDIMTERVCYVSPEIRIDEVMALMTEKRIRHVPVLDSQMNVLTMISIGDLVKETISEQAFQIQQLEKYIAG
jgi:CBS domain-containing protein